LSTQYYSMLFIRRLSYLYVQVFLNAYPLIQAGLNILFCVLQVLYLLYYKNFKENTLLISCMSGEVCILVVFSLTTGFLSNISMYFSYVVEITCVYTVIESMILQFFVMFYWLLKSFRPLYKKMIKYGAQEFVKNYEKRNLETTRAVS
jgi:hypothetical protein